MKLKDYFDEVFVINLARRKDRRDSVTAEFERSGLASASEITFYPAVDGKACKQPSWFRAGDGAWGALQSHIRIVQDALASGVRSVAIFEDDVVFDQAAASKLNVITANLPTDWGQLYFGGQHLKPFSELEATDKIVKCKNVNRLHAYALHSRHLQKVHEHLTNFSEYAARDNWHIDHHLGLAHEQWLWPTYAPAWWIAGQAGGGSNISMRDNPPYWWQPYPNAKLVPLITISEFSVIDPHVFKECQVPDALFDPQCGDAAIEHWAYWAIVEALDLWLLPVITAPRFVLDRIKGAWPAGVVECATLEEASRYARYPYSGLFQHPAQGLGD